MIKNRFFLISSAILFCLSVVIYFIIPNERKLQPSTTVMNFPVQDHNGTFILGSIGAVVFIGCLILLASGLEKYRVRSVIGVMVVFAFLPGMLMTAYQETFASGVKAVSYDQEGECYFETVEEDVLKGECSFVLHNRSNEEVTFEVEFMDSFYFLENNHRMVSLMNLAGPYKFTMEANEKRSIHMTELLDVSDIPNPTDSGSSSGIQLKLIQSNGVQVHL
ncbi:hypothetical protein [Jeotgalibacillus campisalis]|uniref:Uncharacterized protein n=1 Tax=Jeotgalibacillus campisalis TaxID=220754 RepID=A0A0C2W970_9BACL|nr:hypothetical protein [Jeotgalibacillus campisalis]KIL53131.1 hypothetical protein KR50_04600 [Jeotgalibacillus campisalis]